MYSIIEIQDQTFDPAFDLCTVQDVLNELRIDGDATTNASIQSQISLYSKVIASWCDRTFAKEYLTETFVIGWTERRSFLPLSRYPVETVYSVEIDGIEIAATNYESDPITGLLHYICGTWYGKRVAVSYVGGYDLPGEAPAPLVRACVELVKDKRLRTGIDPTIRAIEDDGSRVEYNDPFGRFGLNSSGSQTFPPGVADLMSPFRRMSI